MGSTTVDGLLLEEAQRLLIRQEASVDLLRSRSLSIATVATAVLAFLGKAVLDRHPPAWVPVVGMAAFLVLTVFLGNVLRPRWLGFSYRVENNLAWVEGLRPDDNMDKALALLQRSLVRELSDCRRNNAEVIRDVTDSFTIAVGLLVLQVLFWATSLAALSR